MVVDDVLVTGATGQQGGAVSRALLATGVPVRALVRDPGAPAAIRLQDAGAQLVVGDLNHLESLVEAMTGVRGVFSIQTLDMNDPSSERRHAANLMEAVRTAHVEQVVHTSVSAVAGGSTDETQVGPFMATYHAGKLGAEDEVWDSGAAAITVLRPGIFMENVLAPSMYFPHGPEQMVVAVDLDVPVAWVAVDDIGRAASAAFAEPARFGGVTLELAGEMRSFRDVASLLSGILGVLITVPETPEVAAAEGLYEPMVIAQRLMTDRPSVAHPRFAAEFDLPMQGFHDWAQQHLHP